MRFSFISKTYLRPELSFALVLTMIFSGSAFAAADSCQDDAQREYLSPENNLEKAQSACGRSANLQVERVKIEIKPGQLQEVSCCEASYFEMYQKADQHLKAKSEKCGRRLGQIQKVSQSCVGPKSCLSGSSANYEGAKSDMLWLAKDANQKKQAVGKRCDLGKIEKWIKGNAGRIKKELERSPSAQKKAEIMQAGSLR
jgi:hypothetical protein